MKKVKTERNFLQRPIYPGGTKALTQFLQSNLQYPKAAQEAGIKGIVQLKITISNSGKVIDSEVLHSVGHGCDEEAKRVAALLQFQTPKNRGMKVRFFKKLNFGFGIYVHPEKSGVNPTAPESSYSSFTTTEQHIVTYHYTITTQKPSKK
jgi:TonB family protein